MHTVIVVAASAYVATNLDNLTLLVVLLSTFRDRKAAVISGFAAGAVLIGLASFIIGGAAGAAPVEYLGLLGIVPITLGVIGIGRLFLKRPANGKPGGPRHGRNAFSATLLTQLGNGADTIVTLAALFADSMPAADILIVFTLLATATLFVLIGAYAVSRPALVTVIDEHAHRVTPFILLFVGGYIFANTASDLVAG